MNVCLAGAVSLFGPTHAETSSEVSTESVDQPFYWYRRVQDPDAAHVGHMATPT
jgi:hypothetical protein